MKFFLSLLCIMLLLASSSLVRADEGGAHPPVRTVQIFIPWLPQAQFAGYIMAQDAGFFRANGLDVYLIWANPGDKPLWSLDQGDVEFAVGHMASALVLRAGGSPLVNILQLHQRSASLIVAQRDIKEPKALNGKVMQSWGGDFRVEFDLFLKRNGIVPAKVLPLSSSLAAFLNGLVDGAQAMEYNERFLLRERGMKDEELSVFALADYGAGILGDGMYVREDYLHANRELVRAMRKAVLEGWAYALTHEDETIAAIMGHVDSQNMRTNPSHQRNMLRSIKSIITHRVGANPKNWGILREEDFASARDVLDWAGYPLSGLRYEQFFVIP